MEFDDEKYKIYLEERKQLISAERFTAQQFDKAILTLAAGSLGLSITFIKYLAPTPKQCSKNYLIIAWIFFSLSILFTLISFLTSQSACRRQREILDNEIKQNESNSGNIYATVTNYLNWGSIIFFIFGTIFLIIFAGSNL